MCVCVCERERENYIAEQSICISLYTKYSGLKYYSCYSLSNSVCRFNTV